MAKLRTEKELPHMFTEKLEHFMEIEDYIKKLEFENTILKMFVNDENILLEFNNISNNALVIDQEDINL